MRGDPSDVRWSRPDVRWSRPDVRWNRPGVRRNRPDVRWNRPDARGNRLGECGMTGSVGAWAGEISPDWSRKREERGSYKLLQITTKTFSSFSSVRRGCLSICSFVPHRPRKMRHSHSRLLTDGQVAILEARRKALGLSPRSFRERVAAALKKEGCVHTDNSVKMRIDRVINARMRRPTSEETLLAIATALESTLLELEAALDGARAELAPR